MDIETFLQTIFNFVKNSNNLVFVVYSVLSLLLTQLVKKILVNRVKVEIFHKFNLAVILPFVWGVVFASLDKWVLSQSAFTWEAVYSVLIEATGIGAMASVIYRFVHTLSGNSLTQLLKDDVFGIFYNQLVYFGTVKDQLQSGELKLTDFLAQVKVVASNAKSIYQTTSSESVKRQQLTELLSGLISTENISSVVSVIHKALFANVQPTTTENTTK